MTSNQPADFGVDVVELMSGIEAMRSERDRLYPMHRIGTGSGWEVAATSVETAGLIYADCKSMKKVTSLITLADYWLEIVEPDIAAFAAAKGSVRHAFHAAASLTHMADWVWHSHEAQVRADFNLTAGRLNETEFTKVLCGLDEDFSRIVGTANSSKHMKRRSQAKAPHEPTTSANVISVYEVIEIGTGAIGEHPLCAGPLCGGEVVSSHEVYLEGEPPLKFADVLTRATVLWINLRQTHAW